MNDQKKLEAYLNLIEKLLLENREKIDEYREKINKLGEEIASLKEKIQSKREVNALIIVIIGWLITLFVVILGLLKKGG